MDWCCFLAASHSSVLFLFHFTVAAQFSWRESAVSFYSWSHGDDDDNNDVCCVWLGSHVTCISAEQRHHDVTALFLPYLALPSRWAGYYTCPVLRPYQFGPMHNPDVTKGHSERLWSRSRLWSRKFTSHCSVAGLFYHMVCSWLTPHIRIRNSSGPQTIRPTTVVVLMMMIIVIMTVMSVVLLGSQVVSANVTWAVFSDDARHSTSPVSLRAAFASSSPRYHRNTCPLANLSAHHSTCPADLSTVGHPESHVSSRRDGVSRLSASPPTELVFHAPELAEETLLDVRHNSHHNDNNILTIDTSVNTTGPGVLSLITAAVFLLTDSNSLLLQCIVYIFLLLFLKKWLLNNTQQSGMSRKPPPVEIPT